MWKEFAEELCFNTDCQNRASSIKGGNRCCIWGCPFRFGGVRMQYDIKTTKKSDDENNS